jgi:hypothetical protein
MTLERPNYSETPSNIERVHWSEMLISQLAGLLVCPPVLLVELRLVCGICPILIFKEVGAAAMGRHFSNSSIVSSHDHRSHRAENTTLLLLPSHGRCIVDLVYQSHEEGTCEISFVAIEWDRAFYGACFPKMNLLDLCMMTEASARVMPIVLNTSTWMNIRH